MQEPTESLEEKIARLTREEVSISACDPNWPGLFEAEGQHLRRCLPRDLIGRIEHFGSTAVPGLDAKPIIDMLVEVASLEEVKAQVVPILTAQNYEYVWRPTIGDDGEPWYAWFIKRDADTGIRTHHIHMVEADFPHWERLHFRDYLIANPETAAEYLALKRELAADHPIDRSAYTVGKSAFIAEVMKRAIPSSPDT